MIFISSSFVLSSKMYTFVNRTQEYKPNSKSPMTPRNNKFSKMLLIGFLSLWIYPSMIFAQDISGTWNGQISLPYENLTIVFHIKLTPDGGYTTTIDSPNQGVAGIQTKSTTFQDSILSVQIPLIHASYEGKLNADQTITGTFTQGTELLLNLKKGEAAQQKRPQEPRPPFPYKSEEVTVKNKADGISLAGTLTLPDQGNRFPAVVMVTGSGAQNRDQEILGHKPFLVIADYLSRHGIVVLRCDDRGTGASQGNHDASTNEDFARDTEAALDYLRSRKEINAQQIGIIGHSCGGTIAFNVAAKDSRVAFIVSLAGAAVRGDSLMLRQVELISKSQGMPDVAWQATKPALRNRYAILQQTNKTSEELQKELYADVAKTIPPQQLKDSLVMQQISTQINSMISPWYLHFMRYDPTKDLQQIKCPVLALNGEKDIQVDATMNLKAIQERISENGNKRVTTKAYPKLNHLFQTCEKGTLAEYGQLEETISPEVLKDILEWILK